MWWWTVAVGATLRVDPNDNLAYDTIADAVAASAEGDTVLLTLSGSPYTEAAWIGVTHSLEFRGEDRSVVWFSNNDASGAVGSVTPGVTLRLRNLTLDGNGTQRVVRVENADLYLDEVTIQNGGFDGGGGGAVLSHTGGTRVVVTRSAFVGNQARGGQAAGALRVTAAELTVLSSSFTGNTAASHGGAVGSTGPLRIGATTFDGNTAVGSGGALWIDASDAIVRASTFSGNSTAAAGGALWTDTTVTSTTVESTLFADNQATGPNGGGAVDVDSGATTVRDSWFLRNDAVAGSGGGLRYLGTSGVFERLWLCANHALDEGGGLHLRSVSTVTSTVTFENASDATGGGLDVAVSGALDHLTLVGDRASIGPSVYTSIGPTTLDSSFVGWTTGSGALDGGDADVLIYDAAWFFGNQLDAEDYATVQGSTPAILTDPGFSPPPSGACPADPWALEPPVGSALQLAGLGAWGGPSPFPAFADGDGDQAPFDCDDADPTIPGPELPGDGVDQDCDGWELCFEDVDRDGVGVDRVVVVDAASGCNDGAALDVGAFDCDDDDDARNPLAVDVVGDGIDQDCDGGDDCYPDGDEDGFGAGSPVAVAGGCSAAGFSTLDTDCDDTDELVSPGDAEVVGNADDDDCDGAWDCWVDGDGDGARRPTETQTLTETCGAGERTTAPVDCDDAAADVAPGQPELPGDAVDQDCDETYLCYVDADRDGTRTPVEEESTVPCVDGHATEAPFDCDDTDADRGAGTPEVPGNDVDEDCNTFVDCFVDADRDGARSDEVLVDANRCEEGQTDDAPLDCDDAAFDVRPGATEVPGDGVDQDCDGSDAPEVTESGEAPPIAADPGCACSGVGRAAPFAPGLALLVLLTRRSAGVRDQRIGARGRARQVEAR